MDRAPIVGCWPRRAALRVDGDSEVVEVLTRGLDWGDDFAVCKPLTLLIGMEP